MPVPDYFDEAQFVYSFLMFLALRGISVKILLHGIYEIFLLIFSSMTPMVSQLIFKSFIHLELIFVYGVSWWSSFIFFACSCSDLPIPFVEEATFTPFYASAPFVKYKLTIETWVCLLYTSDAADEPCGV